MLPASGWGPHRSLQAGLNTSLESRDAQPLNLSGQALRGKGGPIMKAIIRLIVIATAFAPALAFASKIIGNG